MGGVLQIRKPRKKRSVMGCALRRQLRSPGRVWGSMVEVVGGFVMVDGSVGLRSVSSVKLMLPRRDQGLGLCRSAAPVDFSVGNEMWGSCLFGRTHLLVSTSKEYCTHSDP